MSLTFDYVSMPPKSQEVSQVQSAQQLRNEHGQQEIAAQFQQEIKNQSEQTIRRNKAENEPNRFDGEGKKQGRKGGSSEKNRKKQKKQDEVETKNGDGHFDMRV